MKRFTQTDAATGRVSFTDEGEAKGLQKTIERLARYEEIGSATDFKIYKQESAKFAAYRKEIEKKMNELNVKVNNLAKESLIYKTEAFHTKMVALVMEVNRITAADNEAGVERPEKDVWLEACENIIKTLKTVDFEHIAGIMGAMESLFADGKKDGDDDDSSGVEE